MYITTLNIENFGPFFGKRIDEIPSGLTLIYGPNEAGKSAIRAFIRMMLFGTLRRNSKEYIFYNYPPIRGGNPSGSISVKDSSDHSFTIHRGDRGKVTITGDESGSDELLNRLTGQISSDVYQNIFSISLSELQKFESMNNDQVRDRIYSAGLGLSTVSLPDASKRLNGDTIKLWSPRGGRLREELKEFNSRKTELLRARSEMGQYEALGEQLFELEKQLADARSNLLDLRSQHARQDRLIGLRPKWAERAELVRQIDDLPTPGDFPVDGTEQLDKLNNELASLTDRVAEGDDKHEKRQREKIQAPVVEAFTDHEEDIRRLISEVEHYKVDANDLPKRRGELTDSQHELNKGLDALGIGWDEAKVSELKDPEALRRQLSEIAREMTNAQHAQEQTELKANGQRENERKARETFEAIVRKRKSIEHPADISANELTIKAERIGRLRAALADRDNVERELRDTNNRISDVRSRGPIMRGFLPWWSHLIGFVSGVLLMVWGIITAETSGMAAGILLSVASIVSWLISRALVNRRQDAQGASEPESVLASNRGDLATNLTTIDNEIKDLLSDLGYSDAPSERECAARLSDIDRDIRQREEFERLSLEAEEAQQLLAQEQESVTDSLAEVERAEVKTQKTVESWTKALNMASLPTDLEPEDAQNVVSQVIELRGRLKGIDILNQRIDGMLRILTDVESRLAPVLGEADRPGFLPEQAAPALESLAKHFQEHQTAVVHVHSLQNQDEEWTSDRQKLAARLEHLVEQKETLLKKSGCEEDEAFRKLGAQIAERNELQHELDSLHRNEPLLVNEEGKPFREELKNVPESDMLAKLKDLSEDVERVDGELNELYGDQRTLQNDRRALEESNPTGEIQQEIGQLQDEVSEDARRWAVLTIARTLLDDTKSEFQQQRQAPLLRTAAHHFSNFTLGRYPDVQRVPGEERIEIVEESGGVKDIDGLSRGTAEQLYLAMRFGLIDDYSQRSEPMPVLMDDVMVNFDENRRRAVCESILEFSKWHQVFVLTCHMAVVDQMRAAADAAATTVPNVIEI